jgi:DNA-directed RNA polymerase specialized sigma24 family protein
MDSEDADDFREFLVTRSAALLRTAYLLTGDRGHAEDLLQSTLIKAYRHWGRVRRTDSPEAYVRRILVNERHRRWRRDRARPDEVIGDVPERTAADEAQAVADRDEVWQAVRAMRRGPAPSWSCATGRTCPRPTPPRSSAARSAP